VDLQLSDKVVVITGKEQGIGRASALAFAREGARLVLAGRDLAAIEPVAQGAVTRTYDEFGGFAARLDAAQAEALAADPLQEFGRIDVLVNVSGGSGPIGKTGWETTPEEFDDIVQLNMKGCFNTMRAVLPTMIAQRAGKVVNVGGTFGMRGRAGRMAYSASKWGLRGITKSFALEAGPHNINVNCVAPGQMDTARAAGRSERAPVSNVPMGRRSSPEEVAGLVRYLCTPAARMVSGQLIYVDGGQQQL